MLVDLTDDEREFIYDKAFWAKMYCDVDRRAALTPEAKKFHEAEYKFYNDLCNKVEGGKDASTKEEHLGDGPEGTGKRTKES